MIEVWDVTLPKLTGKEKRRAYVYLPQAAQWECLEYIPEDITIHRLTGDVPRRYLVSPEWSYKKRTILNGINRRLKEKDIRQGDRCLQMSTEA